MYDGETLTEENFLPAIFEYAERKYEGTGLYDKFFDEFPEKDRDLPEDLAYKDFVSWVVLEKVLPETGKTIAEEFADNTPGLDTELRGKIHQMRDFIRSRFIVISRKGKMLKIKDAETGLKYNVTAENPLLPNTLVEGRIHPFGDHYRFNGILSYATTPLILDPEVMMNYFMSSELKRVEEMPLNRNSRLTTILNKFPIHWIDGICRELGVKERRKKEKVRCIEDVLKSRMPEIVSGLSSESKQALKLCLDNGGFIKYGKLKDFDDDIDFFWEEDEPKSVIGALRQTGLLAVGKMPMGDRNYKVALIPSDIRETLRQALGEEKTG